MAASVRPVGIAVPRSTVDSIKLPSNERLNHLHEEATSVPEAPTDHVEIRFTIDDEARADEISGALLSERLIACAQRIGPITSRYWWSGKLEQSEEWLVLLKTRSELTDRVVGAIVAHHPYETPEVVVLPIVAGLGEYLGWIDRVTAEPLG